MLLRAHRIMRDGPLPHKFPPDSEPSEQARCRAAFKGARAGEDLEDFDDFDGTQITKKLAGKFTEFPDSVDFPDRLTGLVKRHLPSMLFGPTVTRIKASVDLALEPMTTMLQDGLRNVRQRQQELEECQSLLSHWEEDHNKPRLLLRWFQETVGEQLDTQLVKAATLLGNPGASVLFNYHLKECFNEDVADFHRRMSSARSKRFPAFEAQQFAHRLSQCMVGKVSKVIRQVAETSLMEKMQHDILQAAGARMSQDRFQRLVEDALDDMVRQASNGPEKAALVHNLTGQALRTVSLLASAAGGSAIVDATGAALAAGSTMVLPLAVAGVGILGILGLGCALQSKLEGSGSGELGSGVWSEEKLLAWFFGLKDGMLKHFCKAVERCLQQAIRSRLSLAETELGLGPDADQLARLGQACLKNAEAAAQLDAILAWLVQKAPGTAGRERGAQSPMSHCENSV